MSKMEIATLFSKELGVTPVALRAPYVTPSSNLIIIFY